MPDSAIVADADLTIGTGTAEGHLSGSGSHLTFTTSNLSPFLRAAPPAGGDAFRNLISGLAASGMTLSVAEEDATILDMGDVTPSLLAQAFGFSNLRIRKPFRLVVRYLRR